MRVYAPLILQIKRQPSCVSGAKHVHTLMRSSRFLTEHVPSKLMQDFDKCIHRNGYFAHPENILLAMCDDDRQPIRALAYQRILNARNALKETPSAGIRKYKIPLLRYNSMDYVDMICWQKIDPEQQTPPLLRDPIKFDIDLANIPCHSQAVERCVKIVTEASKHVSSESQRDGYIIAKVRHRRLMPSFDTKVQFSLSDTVPEPKL